MRWWSIAGGEKRPVLWNGGERVEIDDNPDRSKAVRPTSVDSNIAVDGLSRPDDPRLRRLIAQLETSKSKFVDPHFDTTLSDCELKKDWILSTRWRRPSDVCKTFELFSSKLKKHGGATPDVHQGKLGDCYVIAALAILFSHDVSLIRKMIVLERPDIGLYCVRFIKNARPICVLVDDRIPFRGSKPLFCSHSGDSIWGALVEKAYAKLHGGSYAKIIGGKIAYAMTDFTGHLSRTFDLRKVAKGGSDTAVRDVVAKIEHMLDVHKRAGLTVLFGCSVMNQSIGKAEEKLANGLVSGHAYAICRILRVHAKLTTGKEAQSLKLVELLNVSITQSNRTPVGALRFQRTLEFR
eukprot:g3335.t1